MVFGDRLLAEYVVPVIVAMVVPFCLTVYPTTPRLSVEGVHVSDAWDDEFAAAMRFVGGAGGVVSGGVTVRVVVRALGDWEEVFPAASMATTA